MQDLASLLSHWTLMEVLHALHDSGVLEFISLHKEGVTLSQVATATETRELQVEACLCFVVLHMPDLLQYSENEGVYKLRDAFDSNFFKNTLYFSRAYAPVLHGLPQLLAGTSEYGVDLVRDGASLSVSSELYASDMVLDVITKLLKEDFEIAVDLGCGSGHISKRVVSLLKKVAVGIDEFSEEVSEIDILRGDQSLQFIHGSILEPAAWVSKLPAGKKIFIASMVLHEFLVDDGIKLKRFFDDYAAFFPSSILYIIEYEGYSQDELTALPEGFKRLASVYQLMHPLTEQGMPRNRMQWQKIFEKMEVTLLGVYPLPRNGVLYKVQL